MANAVTRSGPSSLMIAFIVLSLVTVTLPTLPANAQELGLYSLSGTVSDDAGEPLEGALVTLVPGAEGGQKRETATDEAGAYGFSDLAAGNYTVVAAHACCADGRQPVTLGGTDLSATADLVLARRPTTSGEGDITVSGTVTDARTGAGLPGAAIQVTNWYEPTKDEPAGEDRIASPEPMPPHHEGHRQFTVTSGADGSYTFQVHQGQVELVVDKDGYDYLNAWFQANADMTLDLPLQRSSGDAATLTGVVRSSDGRPIEGASVSVWREWEGDGCDGDACIARSEPAVAGGSSGSTPDGVSWYSRPRADSGGWDNTGPDGSWKITVQGGRLHLSVWANQHVGHQATLTVAAGESRDVPVTLERIPPASVRIAGRVTDATSGEPIPYAQINVQNQRWGTWNWSQADQNGRYELFTQPGYTIVEVSAYRHYWLEDCAGAAVPLDDAVASDGESATMIMPAPDRDCSRERDHEYVSRVFTFSGTADTPRQLDVELPRMPAPDAVFQGWVVNASNDQGVADVRVTFQNQFTREWGEAVTDADGSFRIPVRAGYYTVRTWGAEGYYDAALNTEIASGETKTLTIKVEPGKRADGGYCCIAYAEDRAVAMEGAMAPPSPGMAMEESDAAASAASRSQTASVAAGDGQAASGPDGAQAFQGSGGGLGPYDPSAVGDGNTGEVTETPSAGLLVVLLALAGLAAVVGRRRS